MKKILLDRSMRGLEGGAAENIQRNLPFHPCKALQRTALDIRGDI